MGAALAVVQGHQGGRSMGAAVETPLEVVEIVQGHSAGFGRQLRRPALCCCCRLYLEKIKAAAASQIRATVPPCRLPRCPS